MIKLKCTCGATVKIAKGFECDERFAEDWLTQHKSCRTEYWIARHEDQQRVMAIELESRGTRIKDLEGDVAFYRGCLYSGETPEDGADPSDQCDVAPPPTIGDRRNRERGG